MYIYLYSRHFDIHDLKVRQLPGHVALHYNGTDIEATNGTFTDYSRKEGGQLLPVEEIVSINLLDTTDENFSTHEVSPEDFLQASRFAFILSHNRDIVAHNLRSAYGHMINTLMKRNNYSQALKFAEFSQDQALLNVVGHNGAVYEMKQHNFAAARRFAQHADDREGLTKSSWQSEGVHHYQARRYHDAIKAFKHVEDQEMVRHCYEALFFEEQKKLGSDRSIEAIKQQSGVISHMRDYAKKSNNRKLIDYADSLYKLL